MTRCRCCNSTDRVGHLSLLCVVCFEAIAFRDSMVAVTCTVHDNRLQTEHDR